LPQAAKLNDISRRCRKQIIFLFDDEANTMPAWSQTLALTEVLLLELVCIAKVISGYNHKAKLPVRRNPRRQVPFRI
jgi:hypothetical protein